MTFNVTLDFKRGPSFSMKVAAPTEQDAINEAKHFARGSGWTAPVKKATAVPA